jgi:hypothetical protein
MQIYWNSIVHASVGIWDEDSKSISLSAKAMTKGGKNFWINLQLCEEFLEAIRDVLFHEMCHAAISVIDKLPMNRTHSTEFQAWFVRDIYVRLSLFLGSSAFKLSSPTCTLWPKTREAVSSINGIILVKSALERTFILNQPISYVCFGYKRHKNTIDVTKKRCLCGGSLVASRNAGQITCRYFHGNKEKDKPRVYCRYVAGQNL